MKTADGEATDTEKISARSPDLISSSNSNSNMHYSDEPIDSELAYRSVATILDSLDALVYVSDFETYKILFINRYGRDIWGNPGDKQCFRHLQSNREDECEFCTNDKLLDKNGEATGVYVWEFQNTVNGRWYQCRDQAIRWIDGRLVRMEIATDITDRKNVEEDLRKAKELAERRADTDELTGINNRRSFMNEGDLAIKRALRSGNALSLAMIDIDFFKKVNDNYGHYAGDALLQALARTLQAGVREIDILGRLGGEEFAVVFIDADIATAANICERIRQLIEQLVVPCKNDEINVTTSIGLAALNDASPSLEALLAVADRALYNAKENGRNTVVIGN